MVDNLSPLAFISELLRPVHELAAVVPIIGVELRVLRKARLNPRPPIPVARLRFERPRRNAWIPLAQVVDYVPVRRL